MSQENVEVVRRAIGAMSLDGTKADARAASVQRLARDVQFEHYQFNVEELVDAGEGDVLVCLRIRGRGEGSSAEFDIRPGWIFTVRSSEVVRIRAYYERAEALEAVGLSE